MTQPIHPTGMASTDKRDWVDDYAMRQASGGQDLVDMVRDLQRRVGRLEAQLKTH
jgi:hypothetical protein